jgi:two-component system phosphate regulon sensor histidine kinase PhoR
MNQRRRLIRQFIPFYLLLGGLVFMLTLLAIHATRSRLADHHPGVTTRPDLHGMLWATLSALLAAAAGIGVIHHISRSLERTREGARRFADGDLTFRLDVPASAELGSLAATLNRMAAQLHERIGSMVEGVIALDRQGVLLQINKSAARWIGLAPETIIGRSLHELIRNHELNRLVDETLSTHKPVEAEIRFHDLEDRSMQVYATPLLDQTQHGGGALLVLHDLTRIRRLERMRRDFVANVSHELKTPLTSIKGFVETLVDGALEEPEEAKRFCTIIAKQVDRLQAIIEDLLSLSRIEQEAEQGQVVLKPANLRDVLHTGLMSCAHQSAEKNITVDIVCDPACTARINAPLFEQVVVNLIDNAIKYSDPGKKVSIEVNPNEAHWEIRFRDQGCGIEAAHLARIFERFYRVDKARSRKVGGTGLGLAIVKHIVSAHNGRIRVESQPGIGSTFTVVLPRHDEDPVIESTFAKAL